MFSSEDRRAQYLRRTACSRVKSWHDPETIDLAEDRGRFREHDEIKHSNAGIRNGCRLIEALKVAEKSAIAMSGLLCTRAAVCK